MSVSFERRSRAGLLGFTLFFGACGGHGVTPPQPQVPNASSSRTANDRIPAAKMTDTVPAGVTFKQAYRNENAVDLRHSMQPGVSNKISVTAHVVNAEGQVISGNLASPVTLSFVGTAVTVSPSTLTKGTTDIHLFGSAQSTETASNWGLMESRGGSTAVPYDALVTGFGSCMLSNFQANGDTTTCLTVAPLIITSPGLGPNLSAPLTIAGQIGGPLTVAVGTDLQLSFFQARTGSNDDNEVADTYFTFLPGTMPRRAECQGPQTGFPTAAGAWKGWTMHAYYYANPAIWYWNYGGANCVDSSGNPVYQPGGLSDVLAIGPVSGGRLPYGFAIHGDSVNGHSSVTKRIDLSNGQEKTTFPVTETPH